MNKVILAGRVAREIEAKKSGDLSIAKFTLAVDKRTKKDEEKAADFISCIAFDAKADFIQKYYKKGDGMNLVGHIQTGSYKNRDNLTVYTTDVVVDEVEFPLSNKSAGQKATAKQDNGGFSAMSAEDESVLPFN